VLSITFVIGAPQTRKVLRSSLYWYEQAYVARLTACHMRHIKFSSACLGRQWQRLLVFQTLTEDKRASPSPAWPAKPVGQTSHADRLGGLPECTERHCGAVDRWRTPASDSRPWAFATFMRLTASPLAIRGVSGLYPLSIFNCQQVDDFLGTAFNRVASRRIEGTLILYRPFERDHAIPDRDFNMVGVDIGTHGQLPLDV